MNDQSPMQAAPTVRDIRKAFEGIEQDLLRRDSAFERRALRNYLLHSLLAATGRLDELFEYDTAVADPEYVFFDSGRRIQGRGAIVAFHREQARGGTSLRVPFEQRVAIDAWGFAAEQTVHQFLPGGRLERFRCASVWRCDGAGRMKSLRIYPAVRHDALPLAGAGTPHPAALAAELSSLVSRLTSGPSAK